MKCLHPLFQLFQECQQYHPIQCLLHHHRHHRLSWYFHRCRYRHRNPSRPLCHRYRFEVQLGFLTPLDLLLQEDLRR